WLLVKKYITKSFETSKDIAYIMFLDLLDNLIPVALDIYMHLFRENHFEEYINTIFRLWTIMRRFQRHNYDKIMLAFLSDIQYWKITEHPIINILKTHLNVFDKYLIENFHSLLRCHTSAKVTIGMSLRRDAIFLNHCCHENAFVTSFEA
ncbi:9882_t:CDS:1, partial [Cetraspora pellucida]